MTPHRMALALVTAGCALAVLGVAMLSIPAAVILAGLGVAALGLFAIEVRP